MGKDRRSSVRVGDILSDSQVCQIVKKWVGEGSWQLVSSELRPAVSEGIAGFLGDHFRLTLRIQLEGRLDTIPLFVKSLPLNNAPKAEFMKEHFFNTKEMAIFKLIDEMENICDPNPFVANALLYNESILVMRDLTPEGYSIRNQLETFDLPHVLATLTSLARFHAAFANHETKKGLILQRPYSIVEENGTVTVENNFKEDSLWMHAGAKLAANVIQQFSDKYRTIPDLETKLLKQFLEACDELTEYKDTLNLVLHKDLWANNILFKYENGVPINSILIDFQCVRYGPPAFDITFFIYNTTSQSFRDENESTCLRHYFKIFMDYVDEETKLRLKVLGYDYEEYLRWIEFSRRFAVVGGTMLAPYVLMDPETARVNFDDPATFEKYTNEDRSEPVLAHARRSPEYKRRLVEIVEEFVERYLQP